MRLPPPRATVALIAVTSLAWLTAALSPWAHLLPLTAGFVPARAGVALEAPGLPLVPWWATPISATLLHGSLMHLGFNMLLLGYCGRFVEAALGTWRYLVLYLAGAYVAAIAQYLGGPASVVPMIGASGAVSALLAAQAMLFGTPGAGRGDTHRITQVVWLAAAWVGIQALTGVATGGGVAIAAHIGGFLAGLVLAVPLLRSRGRFR